MKTSKWLIAGLVLGIMLTLAAAVNIAPTELNGFHSSIESTSEGIIYLAITDLATGETTLHRIDEQWDTTRNLRYAPTRKYKW